MNTVTNETEIKTTLEWKDLFTMMGRDTGGRWYATEGTPAHTYIEENGYRTPSRKWPHSHSKPLLTKKFAKWLIANHPAEAKKFNLI